MADLQPQRPVYQKLLIGLSVHEDYYSENLQKQNAKNSGFLHKRRLIKLKFKFLGKISPIDLFINHQICISIASYLLLSTSWFYPKPSCNNDHFPLPPNFHYS